MTRPIKFRAWDKKAKRWAYETEVCLEAGGTYWHWCDKNKQDKLLNCSDIELSEFTGLSDKNGKEIYEGDICRMYWQGHEIVAPMIFNQEKAQFGLDAEVEFESPEHIADVPDRPEVIGNIYENPELLK